MKSNQWIASVFVFSLIGMTWTAQARAAEGAAGQVTASSVIPAGQAKEPEPDYAFGTAKSVNGNQLVINEFDYDTGEEKEMTYLLDAGTKFDNVASAAEISAGDEVDIDYLVKDGKKTAVAVSVAKPVEGEEN